MILDFHNCLLTFDGAGAPVLYIVADDQCHAASWSLAINIRADSNLEQANSALYMRLFDNLGGRYCLESRAGEPQKKLILENRKPSKIVVIKARDKKLFKEALRARIEKELPLAVQREKELCSPPIMIGAFQRHTNTVEKFKTLNTNFVKDALRHHWLHLLTGLLLIEGEKLLLESGNIPLWAKDYISAIEVNNLNIREKE